MASVCTPSLPYPGLARKNSVNIPDSTSGLYADQVVNQSKEQGDKETAELWKWAEVNTPEGKGGSQRREGSGEPDCGQSHGGKSLDRGGEGMGRGSTRRIWKHGQRVFRSFTPVLFVC